MSEFAGFLVYLLEEEQEEQLYDLWKRSFSELSFNDWKKKVVKKQEHRTSYGHVNEDEAIAYANQYIKEKGGS